MSVETPFQPFVPPAGAPEPPRPRPSLPGAPVSREPPSPRNPVKNCLPLRRFPKACLRLAQSSMRVAS